MTYRVKGDAHVPPVWSCRVVKPPKLPDLIARKLYKTGQTRGADDDEIYQNRVGRNSTVLIPYSNWRDCAVPQGEELTAYERGFIVLLDPVWYFMQPDPDAVLADQGLVLGMNTVVFYQTRKAWDAYNPETRGWVVAGSRIEPLGGKYVARVPATTARQEGAKINLGFTTTSAKGAGIRVFEYASEETIRKCRLQLEALLWLCFDSESVLSSLGMSRHDVSERKRLILEAGEHEGLLDAVNLRDHRAINSHGVSVCPLCLEEISALGFASRIAQAIGREVPDQTVTEVSLFHIEELRVGWLQHHPYNVAWGHHHCNVVVKDAGIEQTLSWLRTLLERNERYSTG